MRWFAPPRGNGPPGHQPTPPGTHPRAGEQLSFSYRQLEVGDGGTGEAEKRGRAGVARKRGKKWVEKRAKLPRKNLPSYLHGFVPGEDKSSKIKKYVPL
jgi:hypothetical protein